MFKLALIAGSAIALTSIALTSVGLSSVGPDRIGDPFPLRDCPVAMHEIGEMHEPSIRVYEGREIRFCCDDCIETFEEDLTKSIAEVDALIIADQLPFYPLNECLIGEDPLVVDGENIALDRVFNNRLFRFCCEGCVGVVAKDPAAAIAKLDKAVIDAQRATYPLKTCLISGEDLPSAEDVVEIVVANRLIRLCCDGCLLTLEGNPGLHIQKLDAAWKAARPEMFAPQAIPETTTGKS